MQYEIHIEGRVRQVHVHRAGDRFLVGLEGREWLVDVARIDGHMWSLLLAPPGAAGTVFASHEVTFAPDAATGQVRIGVGAAQVAASLNNRRRWGKREDHSATGPERVTAPMPGKIVRVLVQPGQIVEARQGLVVVEAMKMENELRAARPGTIAEIAVREGQSVDAGALLLVVRPS